MSTRKDTRTDRQLLEQAASALGFYYNPSISSDSEHLWGCFEEDPEQSCYAWNPLEWDDDAFDALARLEASLRHGGSAVVCDFIGVPVGTDRKAAMRRAVVLAAARRAK